MEETHERSEANGSMSEEHSSTMETKDDNKLACPVETSEEVASEFTDVTDNENEKEMSEQEHLEGEDVDAAVIAVERVAANGMHSPDGEEKSSTVDSGETEDVIANTLGSTMNVNTTEGVLEIVQSAVSSGFQTVSVTEVDSQEDITRDSMSIQADNSVPTDSEIEKKEPEKPQDVIENQEDNMVEAGANMLQDAEVDLEQRDEAFASAESDTEHTQFIGSQEGYSEEDNEVKERAVVTEPPIDTGDDQLTTGLSARYSDNGQNTEPINIWSFIESAGADSSSVAFSSFSQEDADIRGDRRPQSVLDKSVMQKKPYLGGYRHKLTGKVYLHAGVQTYLRYPKKRNANVEKFSRDTQTCDLKTIELQTHRDASTQMSAPGICISSVGSKIKMAGAYVTADEIHDTREEKALILQTKARQWLAKRVVAKMRTERDERQMIKQQEIEDRRREKEKRIREEYMRRMHPKTKNDFDLVFSALENWRKDEEQKISERMSGPQRKAALCGLLDDETKHLSTVERHRQLAAELNKHQSLLHFVNKAAAPKKWVGSDGKVTEVDTLNIIQAANLRNIYTSINMTGLTQDERLDVLLSLKHAVQEHDCKLTRDIIELVDREADLIMRGTKETNLLGLRKRILTLFLQFFKNPDFNPEVAGLLKVPPGPRAQRRDIHQCGSCKQFLVSDEFPFYCGAIVTHRCKNCKALDNLGRMRHNISGYKAMLRDLRRAEKKIGDGSRVIYMLQESDLQYLVENIWYTQSILSGMSDLNDLVFLRWDVTQEWSPWNCILLNKEEADAHVKIKDPIAAYGLVFLDKIYQKHTLACNYFAALPGVCEEVRLKAKGSILIAPVVQPVIHKNSFNSPAKVQ